MDPTAVAMAMHNLQVLTAIAETCIVLALALLLWMLVTKYPR